MSFRGNDEALPGTELDRLLSKFWTWNGDPPPPQFSHWTNRGTFVIQASKPGRPTINEVLFNGERLGYGSYPLIDAENLLKGSYDKELGFRAADLLPADLSLWNNLGG